MKIAAAILALPFAAQAAPFLYADPYPPTDANQTQPDAASFTINSGTPIDCVMVAGSGNTKQPKCDLASITQAGTYNLVMTVKVTGGSDGSCTNGTNTATCTQGGIASAPPFSYVLKTSNVSTPTRQKVAP